MCSITYDRAASNGIAIKVSRHHVPALPVSVSNFQSIKVSTLVGWFIFYVIPRYHQIFDTATLKSFFLNIIGGFMQTRLTTQVPRTELNSGIAAYQIHDGVDPALTCETSWSFSSPISWLRIRPRWICSSALLRWTPSPPRVYTRWCWRMSLSSSAHDEGGGVRRRGRRRGGPWGQEADRVRRRCRRKGWGRRRRDEAGGQESLKFIIVLPIILDLWSWQQIEAGRGTVQNSFWPC